MSAPEIRIDEDGTTWTLIAEHDGKAFYANREVIDAMEFPPGPLRIEVPPERQRPGLHLFYEIPTDPRPIVITGN